MIKDGGAVMSDRPGKAHIVQKLTVRTRAAAVTVLVLAAMLHGAMLVFDLSHPDRFLAADRANTRLAAMEGFQRSIEQGTALSYLVSNGIPGDYVPQAWLFALGGPTSVILGQIALFLISLYCVIQLATEMLGSQRWGAVAGVIFVLHPHSLVFTHQLSPEALFTPLVVMSFYFYARYFFGRPDSAWWLLAGSVLLGLATLVRPVTLLWPLMLAAGTLVIMRRLQPALLIVTASLMPVVVWAMVVHSQTGEVSLGESSHDLSSNLYRRAEHIAETLPPGEKDSVMTNLARHQDKRLGVLGYGSLALQYPGAFAQHVVRDALVFAGKSGIERLVVDYLALAGDARASFQGSESGWRRVLEQDGLLAALRQVYRQSPVTVVTSLLGLVLQVALMLLAVYGAWVWLRNMNTNRWTAPKRVMAWAIVLFPVYLFATSLAADAVQSRHRAPSEFVLLILATLGLATGNRVSAPKASYAAG